MTCSAISVFPYLYCGFTVYIPNESMQIALMQRFAYCSPSAHRLWEWGDREELSKSVCTSMGNQMQDLMPAKVNLMDKRVYFNLVTQSNSLHSHTNTCACMSQGGKRVCYSSACLSSSTGLFLFKLYVKVCLNSP